MSYVVLQKQQMNKETVNKNSEALDKDSILAKNLFFQKKSPHLVGLTFGGIFKPKVMEKVQRNRG